MKYLGQGIPHLKATMQISKDGKEEILKEMQDVMEDDVLVIRDKSAAGAEFSADQHCEIMDIEGDFKNY